MHDRTALGPADVDDGRLTSIVADLLGHDAADVVLLSSHVAPVPYDVPAIATAARHRVHGTARTPDGEQGWALFVKVVQSWSRHPFFAFVPPEAQAVAEAGVPWRTEPAVYRSDLADRLPSGLTMPRALAVVDLDELSAAVWLPHLGVREVHWDRARYVRAAHLLGRTAGSPAVRASSVGHALTVHSYLHGRLAHQVLPALAGDELWQHPLSAPFAGVRDELRAVAARAGELVDELGSLPLRPAHGDACPNNLLACDDLGDADGFVLVDFGFWGPGPVGFDLAQLLVGELQLGRATDVPDLAARDAACTAAYVEGLRAEGDDVPAEVVARAHALQLVVFAGLNAPPLDELHEEPTPERLRTSADRAALARLSLDLLVATG